MMAARRVLPGRREGRGWFGWTSVTVAFASSVPTGLGPGCRSEVSGEEESSLLLPSPLYSGERGWGRGGVTANPLTPNPSPPSTGERGVRSSRRLAVRVDHLTGQLRLAPLEVEAEVDGPRLLAHQNAQEQQEKPRQSDRSVGRLMSDCVFSAFGPSRGPMASPARCRKADSNSSWGNRASLPSRCVSTLKT